MRFDRSFQTIEYHTGGQAIRLLTNCPTLPGTTVSEKKAYFVEHLDWLRRGLCREPRGHKDLVLAVMTTEVSEHGDFGLFFADGATYFDGCGEATIGAASAAVEMGIVATTGAETNVTIDTIPGTIEVVTHVDRGVVHNVEVRMNPSYVIARDVMVKVDGAPDVRIDIAMGSGNVFCYVASADLDVSLDPEGLGDTLFAGKRLRDLVRDQVRLADFGMPDDRQVDFVMVCDDVDPDGVSRNGVIWGAGALDRAPCGTGTCGRVALLAETGGMPSSGVLMHHGIVGTAFAASIEEKVRVGEREAVIPKLGARAFITGTATWFFSEDDVVNEGYLIQ